MKKIKKLLLILLIVFFGLFLNTSAHFDAETLENKIVTGDGGEMNDTVVKFLNTVAKFETGNKNIPVNWGLSDRSTAAGYYQFTETTLFGNHGLNGGHRRYIKNKYGIDPFPGSNAYRNGLENCASSSCTRKKRAIMDLTRTEQQALAMALWNRRGADFKKVANGDLNEMYKIYTYYHHTVRKGKHKAEDLAVGQKFKKFLEAAFGGKINVDDVGSGTYNDPSGGGSIDYGNADHRDFETNPFGVAETIGEAYVRQCLNKNNGGIVNFDGPLCSRDKNSFVAFIELIKRILKFIQGAGVIASVIVALYVGFLMLTQGSQSASVSRAKQMLVNMLTGLFFIFAAWLIVSMILVGLGSNNLDLFNND